MLKCPQDNHPPQEDVLLDTEDFGQKQQQRRIKQKQRLGRADEKNLFVPIVTAVAGTLGAVVAVGVIVIFRTSGRNA